MYFLQVQTISVFGLGKLRSDKAAIFYNTTSATEGNINLTCCTIPFLFRADFFYFIYSYIEFTLHEEFFRKSRKFPNKRVLNIYELL